MDSKQSSSETLGQRLLRLRKKTGLTVAEVARSLGISESTYRDWERGRAIQGEPYVQLAGLFDIGLVELLTGAQNGSIWLHQRLRQIERLAHDTRQELESGNFRDRNS